MGFFRDNEVHNSNAWYITGGEPVGYLQAWTRSCTRDYREQIQLAVRAGPEVGALQVQSSNLSASSPRFVSQSLICFDVSIVVLKRQNSDIFSLYASYDFSRR